MQSAARTHGKDVAAFLVDSLRLRLRADILPEAEAALLETINAELAPGAREERDKLIALQKTRELSSTELDQLSHLIDEVEVANAKRWQSIAELATRRGLSLAQIAAQLEIPLP